MIRDTRSLAAICVALSLPPFGCGETFAGGLANAPSARRSSQPHGQHDVISNGPNSCGGGEPGEQYRVPQCANADDADAGSAAAPPNQDKKEIQ
jgi:hypothetical protein